MDDNTKPLPTHGGIVFEYKKSFFEAISKPINNYPRSTLITYLHDDERTLCITCGKIFDSYNFIISFKKKDGTFYYQTRTYTATIIPAKYKALSKKMMHAYNKAFIDLEVKEIRLLHLLF
jgi:hypothetical protein